MTTTMLEPEIDAGQFRTVLGHYPTGVCVITAGGEQPTAMVVGSFGSVSLDPPLVGFLPGKQSSTWPLIEQAGAFCVNVMAQHQGDVCQAVSAKGDAKLAKVDHVVSDHGLPLIEGALATIECRIHSVVDAGDHWFVLGRVIRLSEPREGAPMIFHRGRYGTVA